MRNVQSLTHFYSAVKNTGEYGLPYVSWRGCSAPSRSPGRQPSSASAASSVLRHLWYFDVDRELRALMVAADAPVPTSQA